MVFLAVIAAAPLHPQANGVSVVVDTTEAAAILQALQNPELSDMQALAIARLPGSQGILRKASSYGRPASDALFAQSLVAAAHRSTTFKDVGQLHFDAVRDDMAQTSRVLAMLNDQKLHLLSGVEARVAMFMPTGLSGTVTGHLVLGGTAYGFAFNGEPEMYLDLEHVRSPTLVSTIMEHELFHSVQMLAKSAHPPPDLETACIARTPHAKDIRFLFNALSMEGTASYVGDLLALPAQGEDEPTTKERADFAEIVDQKDRYITDLELSVHGLATNASVTWEEVYAAGFNGNQPFYGIGYVMARAIAQQWGNAAIAALSSQSGAQFVMQYVTLDSYGKSEQTPELGQETVLWAKRIQACSTGR